MKHKYIYFYKNYSGITLKHLWTLFVNFLYKYDLYKQMNPKWNLLIKMSVVSRNRPKFFQADIQDWFTVTWKLTVWLLLLLLKGVIPDNSKNIHNK